MENKTRSLGDVTPCYLITSCEFLEETAVPVLRVEK